LTRHYSESSQLKEFGIYIYRFDFLELGALFQKSGYGFCTCDET
jgi:hypothetical protein